MSYDMIDRFLRNNLNDDDDYVEYSAALDELCTPPAQRTWVGLSPADRGKCLSAGDAHGWIGVMEATEARLKELNT